MPRRNILLLLFLLLTIAVPLQAAEKRHDVPAVDGPSAGPAEAPVTIVEFHDYT
jgi:hypothetical protein